MGMEIGGAIDYQQALGTDPLDYAAEALEIGFPVPTRSTYEAYKDGIVNERNWYGAATGYDYGGTEGKTYTEWVEMLRENFVRNAKSDLSALSHYFPEYDPTSEEFLDIALRENTQTLRRNVAEDMENIENIKERTGFASGQFEQKEEDVYTSLTSTSDQAFHKIKQGRVALRKAHIEEIYNVTKNLILAESFDVGYEDDPQHMHGTYLGFIPSQVIDPVIGYGMEALGEDYQAYEVGG